jgi:replication factor A1
MAIKDLEARQRNVDIVGEILEISDTRTFEKFGTQGRVANAVIKDETGQVKLSLWNEQIDQVKVGDKVAIKNGYVGEWQGELQLTTGKQGTLEVLGNESQEPEKSE